ncbi:hypothetical protein FSP39_012683 [Pinctada imbricata]|uniref:Short-chain collagen C4 n=1 Tax=Pinctada imbricata TaxID=66713 RepID=A0AA88XK44_PINIB|nr:hypothetical protein FSP39_012683 [Pinctada imbricata]
MYFYKGGAQFVRWGKSACPDDDTELVYEGFGADGYYNSYGTGVNFLCLPRDPIFGSNYTGTSYAQVLGAEYDSDAAFFGTRDGDNLPCAVCRSHSSVTNMMLPGRNKCYQNWRKQYNGYLATSSSGSPASKDYICIDENPDALVAGGHNDNGALFYSVVTKCGALACPPYHEGSRLTCVVCTK